MSTSPVNAPGGAPTWQSQADYYESLVQQGGAMGKWAQQNLDVMGPTLKAMGIQPSDIKDSHPGGSKSYYHSDSYDSTPASTPASSPVVTSYVYSPGDIKDVVTTPVSTTAPVSGVTPASTPVATPASTPAVTPATTPAPSGGVTNGAVNGYASQWNTVRFSNTTGQPLTVQFTVGSGQQMPTAPGMSSNGTLTLQPGQSTDVTFAPGTSANFKSTTGDGKAWNQGEVYMDPSTKTTWFDESYIYGANSNMRIYSSDGQKAGYQGDIFDGAPSDATTDGGKEISAPYDPNDGYQDIDGPDGSDNNAAGTYLYDKLPQGEGYVGRGRPAESSAYDDASSLRTTGQLAVVF